MDAEAEAGMERKVRIGIKPMEAIEKDKARSQFDKNEQIYKRLAEEVKFILEHELSKAGIKYHSIVSRVKKFNSFWDKAQEKQMENPFTMTDIVGVRIVCLFLSDIRTVGEVVKASSDVISEDDKIEGQDAASFGYMSLHYDAILKKTYSGARYDQLAGLPFEIQIRTIAMDAWASASHYLDYKTEKDVPAELKRDFYALSGLFYVADQHFEMFFRSRQDVKERVSEDFASSSPNLDQAINLDNLKAYLAKRFPDRAEGTAAQHSDLIQELFSAGYTTIKQVDEVLNVGWDAFLQYERENPPGLHPEKKERFGRLGVVRITFDLWDDNFLAPRSAARGERMKKYRPLLKKKV